jgi:adenylate cyclase
MLRIHVSNKTDHQQFDHADGVIEFGRGPQRENAPRWVIQDDLYVSKDHVRVSELPGAKVRVENLSQRNAIWVGDVTSIAPGVHRDMSLPVRLTVGETTIEIEPVLSAPEGRESLGTIAEPVRPSKISGGLKAGLVNLGNAPDPETLALWFETVISVQRSAAGSPEFYNQTAKALVELVGLDRGLVLLRRADSWHVVARCPKDEKHELEFSRTILQHVLGEKRTFFRSAANLALTTSLQNVEAVVASPVFDANDQVVGALYGSRSILAEKGDIGNLQAQLVQLLASAVGAGLARLEQEAEASRLRVQFEQFFSPNLARELQRNPRLLEGQEREVTIFFTDIRGFSMHAEKLGPRDTCRLVSEVMERITEHVRAFEGVVIDFAGDGLMAMWNAPADQPDHAVLACRAAVAILNDMPSVSEKWKDRLGGPLSLGLGLNTGMALVGNTGSQYKFKYAPLGHTVNLASRVEGATKQMGIAALITGSTRERLGDGFATRRLCRVRVIGISEPVDLHELCSDGCTPEWRACRDTYESALTLFEAGQFGACCRTIYPLLSGTEGRYDIPSLNLAARALEHLKDPPKVFNPVVELTRK